jgi:hypothetical protein
MNPVTTTTYQGTIRLTMMQGGDLSDAQVKEYARSTGQSFGIDILTLVHCW